MLIYFRNNQNTSRSYDFTSFGFNPIALKKIDENQNITINLNFIKDLLAIFSSIFLSALAYGIMLVLIPFRLEANVSNEALISISTIVQIGAGVVFSRFLPSFGKKIGIIKSIILASFIASICSLALFKFINFPIWLIIIYCFGTSLFTSSITRNTVMIDLTPPKIRSIIISIGITLVAFGNGLGAFLLNFIKTEDKIYSFLLASFLFAISSLPLIRLKKADSIVREQKNIAIWRYIFNSPKIFFSGFTFSYIMASCSAFCVIYGLKSGLSKNESSMLLSALLFGTVFYIPIGILCNIFNRRFIMIFSAILSLYIIYLINFFGDKENINILFFLLFSVISGMKLPTLVLINEKYKSTQRLMVNSAFTRVALIGVIFGLITTGNFMKYFGYRGLWYSCTIILIIFITFWFLNYLNKILNKNFSFKELSILYKKTNEPEQEMQ
ncbi:MAG: MFS transporter [Alphaproteobacteria bacterium]